MSWQMHVVPVKEPGEPRAYHAFIGAVKIAEICFDKNATRWKCYLRLMRNHVAYDVRDRYETMSDALKDLHRLLNAPGPTEGV